MAASVDNEALWPAPSRRIFNIGDMQLWEQSEAYQRLLHYIKQLNACVMNRRISDPCQESPMIVHILDILAQLEAWIDDIPPLAGPQRFGNTAFRTFIERLEQRTHTLLQPLLVSQPAAIDELSAYFTAAFGHGTRIDYGSGHELAFVAWLCCLRGLNLLTESDDMATVVRVFTRYLQLVRRLQRTYSLEPAGSHGVWGLDDFQFLPYYWGSAQLHDQEQYSPQTVLDKDAVARLADEFMYLDCIRVIHSIKRGPFHEHSPLLHDIAMVPTWTKVNVGLLRMYRVEVLGKFPVVQHLVFGKLLPFEPAHSAI